MQTIEVHELDKKKLIVLNVNYGSLSVKKFDEFYSKYIDRATKALDRCIGEDKYELFIMPIPSK